MYIKISFFVILLFLTHDVFSAQEKRNRKFTNVSAISNFLNHYIPKKTAKKAFNKKTIHREITVTIHTPLYILSEIFANLPKAVSLANKYAKQKYEIELTNNNFNEKYPCYSAFDGYKTHAEIYPLFEKTNNPAHFKYFCQGIYKTFIPIKGFFFMNVSMKEIGYDRSQIKVNTYFQLSSFFLSSIIYDLRSYKSFRKKMNQIIEATIKNMVAVGRVTSLNYFREKQRITTK